MEDDQVYLTWRKGKIIEATNQAGVTFTVGESVQFYTTHQVIPRIITGVITHITAFKRVIAVVENKKERYTPYRIVFNNNRFEAL